MHSQVLTRESLPLKSDFLSSVWLAIEPVQDLNEVAKIIANGDVVFPRYQSWPEPFAPRSVLHEDGTA